MATGLLGHIEPFDAGQEEWTQYVERVEQFFVANDIVGDANNVKRRATFLSIVGRSSYNLLKSLLAPAKPTDKSFEEIVEVLTTHYSPKPTEVMQRFRFNSRSRKEGESIAMYVAELRSLAQCCNFGDSLNKMLRDRLVWGVKEKATQKKLLAETELTLEKAIQVAQSLEIAESNVKEMGIELVKKEPFAVHKVSDCQGNCYRCGSSGHFSGSCPFRDRISHQCKKVGHLAKVCKSSLKKEPVVASRGKLPQRPHRKKFERGRIRQLADDNSRSDEEDSELLMTVDEVGEIKGISRPPIKVSLTVEGKDINMELDTGASVSVISEVLWPGRGLSESHIRLQTYSKQPLVVLGSTEVTVCYDQQRVTLPLVVVKGEGSALFGRNWLSVIKLNWASIHSIGTQSLDEVLDKYPDVFGKELGKFNGPEVSISVDPDATPQYCKARVLPYAMRDAVEKELDRLVTEGTLEPVECSDWAAPIVAVWKRDQQSIRICGDFRMTVNPVSKLNRYPLPKVEDLFATLSQGRIFTKLDLTQAYQQLKLNAQAQRYVVINTHKGLYRYTRLPFGISSAPGSFQKTMGTLLKGVPGVVVYIDDILIASASKTEHLQVLEEVLSRLATAGLRARKQKCEFMVSQIAFLGHLISEKGISPLPEKIRAIKEAPRPTSVTELKAYLGLLTYYSKFLPQLATQLAPLYKLLVKNVEWEWLDKQEQAFLKSKELLTSNSLLIHYNPSLPLSLACDASSYGVGAVLAHLLPDGSERPIAYASRTLNTAERNYSQIEKEGLSCVFGVKKFYPYLFGHKFTLITDHKPLLGLLSSNRHTSPQASARIRRWSLFLSMYEYEFKFRKTDMHSNADALSRIPLTDTISNEVPPELVLLTTHLKNSIVTADQIKAAIFNDPELSLVLQYVQQGWPNQVPSDQFKPYFNRREELSSMDCCVLWGARVIIPKQYESLLNRTTTRRSPWYL